jgi:hypothetical protein
MFLKIKTLATTFKKLRACLKIKLQKPLCGKVDKVTDANWPGITTNCESSQTQLVCQITQPMLATVSGKLLKAS